MVNTMRSNYPELIRIDWAVSTWYNFFINTCASRFKSLFFAGPVQNGTQIKYPMLISLPGATIVQFFTSNNITWKKES